MTKTQPLMFHVKPRALCGQQKLILERCDDR